MALTKEQLLDVQDREIREVSVPEWGGSVFVRSLTAGEGLELHQALKALSDNDLKGVLAAQMAAYICDESGKPIFDGAAEAAPMVDRKSSAFHRVINEALSLNKMGPLSAQKEKS